MQKLITNIENQLPVYKLRPIPGGKHQEAPPLPGLKVNASPQTSLKFISFKPNVPRKKHTRFLIHTRDEIRVILFDEVVCCIADSNYTFIHLQDGTKVMVSKTLKEVERIIGLPHFFRTHASNLINLLFIKRILKANHFRVELLNNVTLDVSRARRDELMQKLERL